MPSGRPPFVVDSKDLYFQAGSSDKEYHVQLLSESSDTFLVETQWGRRGSTLQRSTNIHGASMDQARRVFDRIVREKIGKGYQEHISSASSDAAQTTYFNNDVAIRLGYAAYDPNRTLAGYTGISGQAQISDRVDDSDMHSWWASGPKVTKAHTPAFLPRRLNLEPEESEKIFVPHLLMPINEDALERYLNDNNYAAQEKKDGKHFTIKRVGGEVIVRNKLGKSVSFHPDLIKALSEIKGDIHLDAEGIGKIYHVFDIMLLGDRDLTGYGYEDRYAKLIEIKSSLSKNVSGYGFKIVTLAKTLSDKASLYNRLLHGGKEGIVFKKLSAPYRSGSRTDVMVKFKFYSTLSARVCAGRAGKSSIGLELLDGDQWVKVGNCTVSAAKFLPIRDGQVAEIKYLYGYKGGSLYQPSFKEIRDDVLPSECLMSQVKYKSEED